MKIELIDLTICEPAGCHDDGEGGLASRRCH